MNAVEFIERSVADLNKTMIDDVKELTPEHLAWKPASKANPIGFIFWHFMRVEDNIIQGFQGNPSVWESEKWYEKLNMDAKVTGNNFQESEIDKVAARPLSELMAYAERVTQNAADYLKPLKDTDLDAAPDPDRPRRIIASILRAIVIGHGWWHAGEIKYLKGLQDMPSPY